ncbi:hypothetical protein BH24ACT4_BH24ACT4_13370 [soil metagenome]
MVTGLGSRFLSSLVDTTLQAAVIAPFLLAAASLGGSAGPALAAVVVLVVGVVVPAAFDAFGGGRTPGRRLTGLQLFMEDGATVSLVPAAVRNIVRIVGFLPSLYSVGAIAVLVTPRHQRLGDLAAGTLVVRSIGARSSAGLVVPGAVRPLLRTTSCSTPRLGCAWRPSSPAGWSPW